MQRWDYKRQRYVPYKVPAEWNVPLVCFDMEEDVNCAACGRAIKYGDGFTSREIHTAHGIGYTVCRKCHEKELKEELR